MEFLKRLFGLGKKKDTLEIFGERKPEVWDNKKQRTVPVAEAPPPEPTQEPEPEPVPSEVAEKATEAAVKSIPKKAPAKKQPKKEEPKKRGRKPKQQ